MPFIPIHSLLVISSFMSCYKLGMGNLLHVLVFRSKMFYWQEMMKSKEFSTRCMMCQESEDEAHAHAGCFRLYHIFIVS